MREIKFRAWDSKEKKWLLGYEYSDLGGFSMFGEVMLFQEWSKIINRFILQQKDRTPDDLILMQFTGLHDKNGEEIYEGDIVRFYLPELHGHKDEEYIEPVEFVDGCFCTGGAIPLNAFIEDTEIIGNVYENTDLIDRG